MGQEKSIGLEEAQERGFFDITPQVPRPFDAVKSFANDLLEMLDKRVMVAERNSHPFNDKFGDHPETIVAANAAASELREVRTQVRILGDRALVELMRFKRTTNQFQNAARLLREQGERERTYELQDAFNRAAQIVERMGK